MNPKYKYIAIEGNIGAGKTTLAHLLAERSGAKLLLEQFEENPYLGDFYRDPKKFALPVETFFLESRFRQAEEFLKNEPLVVSDYLWEKSSVFASVNLSGEELEQFQKHFQTLKNKLRQPDVVLFINRPVDQLLNQIGQRGRPYEQKIPRSYLERLGEAYGRYFSLQLHFPVLWLENGADAETLAAQVWRGLEHDFHPGVHVNPA